MSLGDGSKRMIALMIDAASSYIVAFPLDESVQTAKTSDLLSGMDKAWVSWAGAMKVLR